MSILLYLSLALITFLLQGNEYFDANDVATFDVRRCDDFLNQKQRCWLLKTFLVLQINLKSVRMTIVLKLVQNAFIFCYFQQYKKHDNYFFNLYHHIVPQHLYYIDAKDSHCYEKSVFFFKKRENWTKHVQSKARNYSA